MINLWNVPQGHAPNIGSDEVDYKSVYLDWPGGIGLLNTLLRRLKAEEHKFKAWLGYKVTSRPARVMRSYQKKTRKEKKKG